MSLRRYCGVHGHPPLTPDEQQRLEYWDGSDMIQSIDPLEASTFSDVDRILHKHCYPGDKILLAEVKQPGQQLSPGQVRLHQAFRHPTLAEVMHVVAYRKEDLLAGLQWAVR